MSEKHFYHRNQAMIKATKMVFPKSSHKLCICHISNNAQQHLVRRFTIPNFKAQFNKCFNGCKTDEGINLVGLL